MIDPVVVLGILAIYFGGAFGLLKLARDEVWKIRDARTGFYQAHVDKVTRLERAKETELISTIYTSATLKAIYSRPEAGNALPPLTREERKGVETEIEQIKSGLKGVTDARGLFDGICTNHTAAADTLWKVALGWFAVSLAIPVGVILLGVSSWNQIPAIAFGLNLIVIYFGGLALAEPTKRYRRAQAELVKDQLTLTRIVEETIYGLAPTPEDTPPAGSRGSGS